MEKKKFLISQILSHYTIVMDNVVTSCSLRSSTIRKVPQRTDLRTIIILVTTRMHLHTKENCRLACVIKQSCIFHVDKLARVRTRWPSSKSSHTATFLSRLSRNATMAHLTSYQMSNDTLEKIQGFFQGTVFRETRRDFRMRRTVKLRTDLVFVQLLSRPSGNSVKDLGS